MTAAYVLFAKKANRCIFLEKQPSSLPDFPKRSKNPA